MILDPLSMNVGYQGSCHRNLNLGYVLGAYRQTLKLSGNAEPQTT